MLLDTESTPLRFEVALVEHYMDEGGYASTIIGVGLIGADSDLVMPGDTLWLAASTTNDSVTTTSVHVTVDENRSVEVQQQLHAV